ncbi:MAG TPA: type I-C CRISPR-associated protein Cas5c [Thermomicrobiales bacterium]|nr:type I-C CRISPR-associated protein Cas5c [Thermomicrobiales bacterium]
MQESIPLAVKVWADFACFTRPEMKVERVTYPVMTPSAACGVLESVFWKPEFRWRVETIEVLRPIRYFSILRNEVNGVASERAARAWERGGGGFFADEDRAQRHTLALRDVAYVIRAQIELRPHADADVAKYRDQFRRRVAGGRCFARPYLGCREFAADFAEPDDGERPIDLSDDLGPMLFDLAYPADGTGSARARFFTASLDQGVLYVPQELYARGG